MKLDFFDIKNNKFVFITFVCFVIYYPIISSGFLQNDDLGRSFSGYYNWEGDGRILSDWIMKFFLGSGGVFNISPFFQILAINCMSLTCMVLMSTFGLKKNIFSILAVILTFCTTGYVENISYVYDSFPMFLSIFFSVIAVYLIKEKQSIISFSFSCGLLFLSLNLYQVALNVYLVFLFCVLSIQSLKGERTLLLFLMYMGSFLCSLICYKVMVLFFYNLAAYASSKAGGIGFSDLYLGWGDTIYKVYSEAEILVSFRTANVWCMGSLLFFPFGAIFCSKNNIKNKATSVIFLCCCFISVPGVLLLLSSPVIVPRTLVGLGALISACVILCIKSTSNRINLVVLNILVVLIFIFFITYTYGHGVYQRNLQINTDKIYPEIAELMNKYTVHGDELYVLGEPNMPQSIVYNKKYEKLMQHISYQPLRWSNWWGYIAMKKYGFNDNANFVNGYDYMATCDKIKKSFLVEKLVRFNLTVQRNDKSVYFIFGNVCS